MSAKQTPVSANDNLEAAATKVSGMVNQVETIIRNLPPEAQRIIADMMKQTNPDLFSINGTGLTAEQVEELLNQNSELSDTLNEVRQELAGVKRSFAALNSGKPAPARPRVAAAGQAASVAKDEAKSLMERVRGLPWKTIGKYALGTAAVSGTAYAGYVFYNRRKNESGKDDAQQNPMTVPEGHIPTMTLTQVPDTNVSILKAA